MMITYKICICDDESFFSEKLEHLLTIYAKECKLSFDIHCFSNEIQFLEECESNLFHLLFIDIKMEFLSGLEVAEKIRSMQSTIPIVFVTAYDNYALDAFRLNADGYLVKPFTLAQLRPILKRNLKIIDMYANQKLMEKRFIPVKTPTKWMQLSFSDILYITKSRNKVYFYTVSGKYETYASLKEVMERLDNKTFILINQSQIINWRRVDTLHKNYIAIGDVLFKPTRQNAKKLNRLLELDMQRLTIEQL